MNEIVDDSMDINIKYIETEIFGEKLHPDSNRTGNSITHLNLIGSKFIYNDENLGIPKAINFYGYAYPNAQGRAIIYEASDNTLIARGVDNIFYSSGNPDSNTWHTIKLSQSDVGTLITGKKYWLVIQTNIEALRLCYSQVIDDSSGALMEIGYDGQSFPDKFIPNIVNDKIYVINCCYSH